MHTRQNSDSGPRGLARTMIAGVALAAVLGFSLSAQAQISCTVGNWEGGSPGLSDDDAGTQGNDNRRYGGPCGLRVPVNGDVRYVSDNRPDGETEYLVRFYAFLDNAGDAEVKIYQALDNADSEQISISYDPGASTLTLNVAHAGGTEPMMFTDVQTGWHSIGFSWSADGAAEIEFALNRNIPDGGDNLTAPLDTSGRSISEARLGNIEGANPSSAGSIDFDDYDSRRSTFPERLVVGDATNSGSVTTTDYTAILNEVFNNVPAAGQPDCTENGSVTTTDATCVLNIVF